MAYDSPFGYMVAPTAKLADRVTWHAEHACALTRFEKLKSHDKSLFGPITLADARTKRLVNECRRCAPTTPGTTRRPHPLEILQRPPGSSRRR